MLNIKWNVSSKFTNYSCCRNVSYLKVWLYNRALNNNNKMENSPRTLLYLLLFSWYRCFGTLIFHVIFPFSFMTQIIFLKTIVLIIWKYQLVLLLCICNQVTDMINSWKPYVLKHVNYEDCNHWWKSPYQVVFPEI